MSSILTAFFRRLLIAGCSCRVVTGIGPAGVGVILDPAGEGSPDELVSILKRDLLTQGAGVVRPGNAIRMFDLMVGVSGREITEGCDSTNSYTVSMGLCAP